MKQVDKFIVCNDSHTLFLSSEGTLTDDLSHAYIFMTSDTARLAIKKQLSRCDNNIYKAENDNLLSVYKTKLERIKTLRVYTCSLELRGKASENL